VRARRIRLLIDAASPLDRVDKAIADWHAWSCSMDLSATVVVFGERASWAPGPPAKLRGTAVVKGVGPSASPALGDALARVAERDRPDALLTILAGEPAPGWHYALRDLDTPFRACVNVSREPAAAMGQGHLGAPFRGEHLDLALRWITRELCDRSWRCACGEVRVYPQDRARPCSSCGSRPEVPPRLRVRDRIILLTPGALLYPHHVGKPLDFDQPLASLDEVARRDGTVSIAGFDAEMRTGQPRAEARRRSSRFRAPGIRTVAGKCHACEGALEPPVLHQPPDPRRFCAKCGAIEARCDFCGAPIGARGNVWPDGRSACRECWTTAATDAPELEALGGKARAWMKRRLGMEMPDCPLHFEHAAAIARMHGLTFRPRDAFSARPIGFFRKPIEQTAAIFVEHGQPTSAAYGIVVHELTHLWQWENWPRDRALTLVEGLAMWVEYQALLDAGAIHAARHSERYGDPVYGLGFRIALAIEKEAGFDAVKDRMRDVVSVTVHPAG
jgi:hypothetical protein